MRTLPPVVTPLFFVLAAFTDDVGDIIVPLFLFFDEGGLFGFLDLDIVAVRGIAGDLLAFGLGVGVLKRNELDVRGLRRRGLGLVGGEVIAGEIGRAHDAERDAADRSHRHGELERDAGPESHAEKITCARNSPQKPAKGRTRIA